MTDAVVVADADCTAPCQLIASLAIEAGRALGHEATIFLMGRRHTLFLTDRDSTGKGKDRRNKESLRNR